MIKQAVITGEHQAELAVLELDVDTIGLDEVLIETEHTFISAGTELAIYTGKESRVHEPGSWCEYPWKSGYANVGIVRHVGGNVTRVKVGQRVFTFGPHASMVKVNQNNLIIEVPKEIDPRIAVASRMAGVAYTSIILSDIPRNAWVVVFGLGMVGNFASQLFQIQGCKVICFDPIESRRELAKKCGIKTTISGSDEEVQKQISEITEGSMAHIAVDAVGHSQVVLQALNVTANHGQLILLGSPRVTVQHNMTEFLSDIHHRFITLRGAMEWCLPVYSEFPYIESLYSKQEKIFDWIKTGRLKIEPQISHRFNPEYINEAYDGLLKQPDNYTGVVLDWK